MLLAMTLVELNINVLILESHFSVKMHIRLHRRVNFLRWSCLFLLRDKRFSLDLVVEEGVLSILVEVHSKLRLFIT